MSARPLELRTDPLGAAYPVHLPIFEGPLDLLLHLIEREELDITTVSLVAVTDQYLRALEEMEEIEPGALADFLVVAARLLYLKSLSLLPRPRQEEDDEEDAGDALVRQLLEYRQFKSVAEGLRLREEARLRAFVRLAPPPQLERKLDLSDLTLDKLSLAVQRALRRMPTEPPPPRVHTYPISVADRIQLVRERVRSVDRSKPISFSSLLSESRSRLEVIVTFLAVLELVKQQEIVAEQEKVFGEIVLKVSSKPRPGKLDSRGETRGES